MENKRPTGFNVDVFRAVAEVMSLDADIRLGPWSEMRSDLESGRIDVITGMYYSRKRAEKVDFSIPHIIVTHALFVRNGSSIRDIEDVQGKELIVQQGDIMHDYAAAHKLTRHIIPVADQIDALRLLSSGQHDCALLANLQGQYLMRKYKIPGLTTVGPPIEPRKYCFAVKKGDDLLLAKLNEGLNILKSSGRYQQIYEKWFSIHAAEPLNKELWQIVLIGSLPVTAILLLSFLWTWSLRRQVRKKTEMLTQELSERQKAENALKGSEKKYRDLVQSANSIIIRVNPQGRIKFANWFAIHFFGFPEDKFIGKSVAETIFPAQKENNWAFSEIVQQFFPGTNDSQPGAYQLDILKSTKRNGEEAWIAWTRNLIYDNEDKAYELLCIGNDITDKKRVEEKMQQLEHQLQQARKMEAIGTLSGGIAHDFNNILTIILGNAELAKLERQSAPISRHLKEIISASLRAKKIIRQLLNFCRQSSDEKDEKRALPISPLIKDSLRMMKSLIPANIRISCLFCAGSPVILGDAAQIHQLIMNLCLNAVQSMEKEGGTLTIKTDKRLLSEEAEHLCITPGPYVCLSIQDTGCGIRPDIIDRIYEPYFTTKPFGESSGFGLSIVHGIVEHHDGAITVDSSQGIGTCFSVYFPSHTDHLPQADMEDIERLEPGSGRILFVDDEPDLVRTGSQMLEHLGYTVKESSDPQKALEIFIKTPEDFDLVITDMTMPNLNGDALARKLLAIQPDIPIVMCTGYNKFIDKEKALAAGIQFFIEKPYEFKELANIVRQAIVHRRQPEASELECQ